MAQSQIRWKHGDYVKLGRAVSEYNKTINEHRNLENSLYLPETITYSDLKENIATRKEFNRILSSLKRIKNKNAFDLITLEGGQTITHYQEMETDRLLYNIIDRLSDEMTTLYTPDKSGFSKAQMGAHRVKEITSTIGSVTKYKQLKGFEFNLKLNRIENLGREDYTMRKSITYRNNFMRELENLATNNSEFKPILNYFNKITNPIEFFEVTQRSNALQDFFTWYQNPENYAGFTSTEDLAESILSEYDDTIDNEEYDDFEDYDDFDDVEEIKKKKYKYSLIARTGQIVSQSNNKRTLINMIMQSKDPAISNGWVMTNY